MTYEYKGATSKTEIEADDTWSGILSELDRIEYNNNQTETRRHVSLDAFNLDGTLFPSEDDVPGEIEEKERDSELYAAIKKLKPAQTELIRNIYFNGISVSDYAKIKHVSQPAISQRLATAIKKLKQFL